MKTYKNLINEISDMKYKKITDSDILESGQTEIWYWKKNINTELLPESIKDLNKTHVLIGKIKDTDKEDIYKKMQGENWSPAGEASNFINESGINHTSMSTNDIIVIEGKMWVVDEIGFKQLGAGVNESIEELFEAMNDENKATINAVKKYFKDSYNFPGVRFKTIPKANGPILCVSCHGDNHTFNTKDLEQMLTIKYGDSAPKSQYIRADYIEGTVGEWKTFIDSQGVQ